jgi:transposase
MSSQSTRPPTTGIPETATAVGVDLGVKRLVVAATADAGPDVTDALVVGGGVERDLYDGLGDTLTQLDSHRVDTTEAEQQAIEQYRGLLQQRFALAAQSVVEYADRHDADVVALENIDYEGGTLAECARGRTKAGEWVLPTFRDRLEATLAAEGFHAERVDHTYSTQQCHICGELADVSRATITCKTPSCPVDDICRDRSAAATLAKRAY